MSKKCTFDIFANVAQGIFALLNHSWVAFTLCGRFDALPVKCRYLRCWAKSFQAFFVTARSLKCHVCF